MSLRTSCYCCLSSSVQRRPSPLSKSSRQIHCFLATVPNHNDDKFENDYTKSRRVRYQEIQLLPEVRASRLLTQFLRSHTNDDTANDVHSDIDEIVASRKRRIVPPTPPLGGYQHVMSREQIRCTVDAVLSTFCLQVEARIAALLGQGFYTIGPCGEEALSAAGLVLRTTDSAALHYRHLGINLARQMQQQQQFSQMNDISSNLADILLDRARGYVVSRLDPVTGGVHCSIGSPSKLTVDGKPATCGGGDFVVTSTLASQCPAAVGRALGYSVLDSIQSARRNSTSTDASFRQTSHCSPVSFVTLGDGSIHNHHFWSAFHLARHARHRRIKCPVVFGISDNGLSISYKTKNYVSSLFSSNRIDPLVPHFTVNGNDMMHVYDQTFQAVEYARKRSAPAVILYQNLVRRFGHAATDRQQAYLTQTEIQDMAEMTLLESTIVQAVDVYHALTYREVNDRFLEIQNLCQTAFATAANEEKVNRQDMLERVAQPLVPVPALPDTILTTNTPLYDEMIENKTTLKYINDDISKKEKRQVMRKHMTRVIQEVMDENENVVYLGEDVEHGGYYVVTEGLATRFPGRVIDFPPDETSLLGAAMGFSQIGLLPIVEIPYSKYLDCGVDSFYEIAVTNWLTNGQRPNGMIIRLQGFDRGLFGGNFHTNNTLQHVPPGVDVVCYSNGEDYVRGFRHALVQARAGRVVMIVDCTNLLNLRHLFGNDRVWERSYPSKNEWDLFGFDDIRRYGTTGAVAIVTYGNGVLAALKARRLLAESEAIKSESFIDVIDCPYISGVPRSLCKITLLYSGVVFADVCKDGAGSNVLSSMAISLHRDGLLPVAWDVVAAPRTYNPLGSTCTFLNETDIADMTVKILAKLPPEDLHDNYSR